MLKVGMGIPGDGSLSFTSEEKDFVLPRGVVLRLRKVAHWVSDALTRKHTTRGKLDEFAFNDALWAHILVSWKGLQDATGTEVPSEPLRRLRMKDTTGMEREVSLAYAVALALPGELAHAILNEARAPEFAYQEALGNSSPPSPSAGEGARTGPIPSIESESGKPKTPGLSTSTPN